MNTRIPKNKIALAEHIARMKLLEEQESKRKEYIERKNSEDKKILKTASYCRVANYDQF